MLPSVHSDHYIHYSTPAAPCQQKVCAPVGAQKRETPKSLSLQVFAIVNEERATYAAKILVRVVKREELQGNEKATTPKDNG
jgi:hypothetical protein